MMDPLLEKKMWELIPTVRSLLDSEASLPQSDEDVILFIKSSMFQELFPELAQFKKNNLSSLVPVDTSEEKPTTYQSVSCNGSPSELSKKKEDKAEKDSRAILQQKIKKNLDKPVTLTAGILKPKPNNIGLKKALSSAFNKCNRKKKAERLQDLKPQNKSANHAVLDINPLEQPFSNYDIEQSKIKSMSTWTPVKDPLFDLNKKKYRLKMMSVPCVDLLDMKTFFHKPGSDRLDSSAIVTSVPLSSPVHLEQQKADDLVRLEKYRLLGFKTKLNRLFVRNRRNEIRAHLHLPSKYPALIKTADKRNSAKPCSSNLTSHVREPKRPTVIAIDDSDSEDSISRLTGQRPPSFEVADTISGQLAFAEFNKSQTENDCWWLNSRESLTRKVDELFNDAEARQKYLNNTESHPSQFKQKLIYFAKQHHKLSKLEKNEKTPNNWKDVWQQKVKEVMKPAIELEVSGIRRRFGPGASQLNTILPWQAPDFSCYVPSVPYTEPGPPQPQENNLGLLQKTRGNGKAKAKALINPNKKKPGTAKGTKKTCQDHQQAEQLSSKNNQLKGNTTSPRVLQQSQTPAAASGIFARLGGPVSVPSPILPLSYQQPPKVAAASGVFGRLGGPVSVPSPKLPLSYQQPPSFAASNDSCGANGSQTQGDPRLNAGRYQQVQKVQPMTKSKKQQNKARYRQRVQSRQQHNTNNTTPYQQRDQPSQQHNTNNTTPFQQRPQPWQEQSKTLYHKWLQSRQQQNNTPYQQRAESRQQERKTLYQEFLASRQHQNSTPYQQMVQPPQQQTSSLYCLYQSAISQDLAYGFNPGSGTITNFNNNATITID